MLRYVDMFPGSRPDSEREKAWDEEVKAVREAWEIGRERHARTRMRSPRPVEGPHAVGAAF